MTRIKTIQKKLRRLEKTCCQTPRDDLPPAAQWLRDNARALYSAMEDIRQAPCRSHRLRQLRDFGAALTAAEKGSLTARAVYAAAEERQKAQLFTVRELRALPAVLMQCEAERLFNLLPIIEKEIRCFAQGAALYAQLSAGMTVSALPQEEIALSRALDMLSQSGDAEDIRQLEALIREKGLDPRALRHAAREQLEETARQTGGVIHALKTLPRMPWGRMTQRLSVACQLLSQERTFRRMDDTGRETYLTQVSRLSERAKVSEERVCCAALQLTNEQTGAKAECGYYLLEDADALMLALGKRLGLRSFCKKHALALYLAAQISGAAAVFALTLWSLPWYFALFAALLGTQFAQQLFRRAVKRLTVTLPLPRLQAKALPQGVRCLIVVPTILMDKKHALRMVRQLSVLHLANPGARFDYMLLSDFTDANAEETPADSSILEALEMGIQSLNDAYGSRFHALHRRRVWDAVEGCFIGHERKRGALKMLTQLICGEETQESLDFSTLPPASLRGRWQAVITLDADTFLPSGAAERMLCTLFHPLQRGRAVLLQPRMTTLPMHLQTRVQEYLGGFGGTDSYNAAANDLYEDLFRRGSFMGKGIFEPRAFYAATRDLPNNRILSHDLLEGELTCAHLLSDVQCFDGHPRTVEGFLKRAHRWTRGDWQLLPFLRGKRLDALAKFKIIDNLRLSLLPLMRIVVLLASAAKGAYLPFLLAALPLFSRAALWQLCLLPMSAHTRADAILRALWRQAISHKRLLQWTTAAQADQSDFSPLKKAVPALLSGAALMIFSGFTLHIPGFMLGAAWLLSPVLAHYLNAPCRDREELTEDERAFLAQTAQDTLAFYRAHVTAHTHFLPPDNVQLSPPRGAAMRTSPTNVGMYLLSLCAARKMDLMDSDEMLRSMERTALTLQKLPVWHGVPYNWYDIETLQPLHPMFVSSVDAGNLCMCLLAAAQCARVYMHECDAALRGVPTLLDDLSRRMQLKKLYDRREDLFHIGYDAEGKTLTDGHYDMMASEALLLSYAAIALQQAPEKHWWRLGRTWTRVQGGKTLLSFGGTMFEYLLPAVLLPAFRKSALSVMHKGCVSAQMHAVSDGPFGISEAGYARFDEQLNYAYKAFGVRALSLDGNCNDSVRAPYAAALALCAYPHKACQALMQFKNRGVYGMHGFFESEDYASAQPPRVICSHMAHHQGMILCAVCNALHDDYLPRLLFSLPKMRAHLPLLCETPPRHLRALPKPLQLHRDAPNRAPLHLHAQKGCDMHILSGGGTTLFMTASGHSRLLHSDIELTRFHPMVGAVSGPQVYVRIGKDSKTARLTDGDMLFTDGDWRAHKTISDLRADVSGCVDPLTGAVIYAVRLRSGALENLQAEVTLYLEPALETIKADSTHEAFSNLFITVNRESAREITVTRRLRNPMGAERKMRVRVLGELSAPLLFMNDRSLFLGRQGSIDCPRGLTLPNEDFIPNNTAEPCAALRLPVLLPPKGDMTLYAALGLDKLPENAAQAARAFSLCGARSEVIQRMLSLDSRQTALMLRLCARMTLTGFARKMHKNDGVRALWAQGVSGDQPILLITAQNASELPVVTQTLRLAACLFEHGAPGEIVILIPEENDYEQPLRAGCEAQVRAFRALQGRARMLFDTDEAFRFAALMLCSMHVDAAVPLRDQLNAPPASHALMLSTQRETLPGMHRLLDFNGIGGFTPEGGYTIIPTETGTPAPWSHMLSGDAFGTLVCEQGLLYSHMGNSRLRRITHSGQDSVLIQPAEEYFILDSGRAYALTQGARVTYEPGTAQFECALPALQATLSCFTDADHPAGVRILHVKNTGGTEKTFTICAAARFAMGEDGRGTYVYPCKNGVHAQNAAMPGESFFHLENAASHTVSESAYAPAPRLRDLSVSQEGTVGILKLDVTLQPGQTHECAVILGFCEEIARMPHIITALSSAKGRLRAVRGYWDQRLSKMQFFLPDSMLSTYLNGFLPYQIRASRLMLRAGFYQSGGAFGFRDQLQDMLPLLYTEPETVRQHLLLCASRQYLEGDVQHWWHPYGAGVRTRISDDLLFLPYVTARYVYVTGDRDILKARAPYLTSPVLNDDEHDRYEAAETAKEAGTLLEHCLRAVDHITLGEHGLPLMGGGDWNDGMDQVQGESVWLAFFFLMVLRDFAPLCDQDTQRRLNELHRRVFAAAQETFRGKWFLRAWYLDGRSIGAHDSDVPRIDLISQCFAAFAGMPRAQVITALDRAWEFLHDGQKGLTKLMDPPFAPDEKAGYIGAYLPGVRENGGQYTHAVPWFMRALLMTGRTERAFTLLHEILPFNHAFDLPSARHYRTEPYALPADVYRWGRGGWTWYTGSAAWLYDVYLRDFLGFDKRGNEVTLRPILPADWEECTLLYHFGSSRYQLTATKDTLFITLDGARVRGEYIPLTDDGRTHEARFPARK